MFRKSIASYSSGTIVQCVNQRSLQNILHYSVCSFSQYSLHSIEDRRRIIRYNNFTYILVYFTIYRYYTYYTFRYIDRIILVGNSGIGQQIHIQHGCESAVINVFQEGWIIISKITDISSFRITRGVLIRQSIYCNQGMNIWHTRTFLHPV